MKTKGFLQVLVIVMLILMTLSPNSVSAQSSLVLYVKQGGLTNGSCDNWDNACDLQYALTNAISGQEIWVAAGVYKPDTEDRSANFRIISGVGLFGGFDATESTRDQRDWQTNITILSGDIGIQGDVTDNSYHVVTAWAVDATAVLDGFTITDGNANGDGLDGVGGGMFNDHSNPILKEVTFIANMAVSGGGMYNENSSPSLINVTFSGNTATTGGGMSNLISGSKPSLTNVTFIDNTATENGGGMYNASWCGPSLMNVTFISNSAGGDGGGMSNQDGCSPSLVNVTFSFNSATNGGGMNNYLGASPSLSNVTFNGNSATVDGGGMNNNGGNSAKLMEVTFINNTAGNNGGGMSNSWFSSPTLVNVTFSANTAGNSGGGISNMFASSPSLTNVSLRFNSAAYGGGLYSFHYNDTTLTNVIFRGNTATVNGGGIYNELGSPSLTDVTIDGNTSTINGGGMFNAGGMPSLKNVTFSSNLANNNGGGMFNDHSNPNLTNVTFSCNTAIASGGGIFIDLYSEPKLINVTFSGNTATINGGGMYVDRSSSPVIRNSILWGNGSEIVNADVATNTLLIEDSLIQGGCPVGGICNANIIDIDPLLGALANSGGYTQTLALGAGSPAINAGNDATCATTDQRGVTRPQGDHCDMGAYEYEGPINEPPVIIALTALLNPVQFGQSMDATVEFSDTNVGDTHTVIWNWGDGSTNAGSSASETHLYAQPGVYTITVTVTDIGGLSDTDTTTITILPWTLNGFYQPVDMNGVYNVVKNGSTVPLKFEIFAGSAEITDIVAVKNLTYAETACNVNAVTDEIELTATGSTNLRYDTQSGQFIYNWKSPTSAGKCYRVTMTTMDNSSLVAYFKIK